MIQPVSAFSPRAGFRGANNSYGRYPAKNLAKADIAFLNAGGIAAALGATTMAVTRNYTRSWSHAAVLGLFASFLTLFFMTPQILAAANIAKPVKNMEGEVASKAKFSQFFDAAKEHLKPAKKMVQFRQADAPSS